LAKSSGQLSGSCQGLRGGKVSEEVFGSWEGIYEWNLKKAKEKGAPKKDEKEEAMQVDWI